MNLSEESGVEGGFGGWEWVGEEGGGGYTTAIYQCYRTTRRCDITLLNNSHLDFWYPVESYMI